MVRAGLEDKGQTVSKQDVKVELKLSVALLASRDASCLGGGSEDETIAASREGEVLLLSTLKTVVPVVLNQGGFKKSPKGGHRMT